MKFEVILTRDDGTTAVLATATHVPAVGADVWDHRCDMDVVGDLSYREARQAAHMCADLSMMRIPAGITVADLAAAHAYHKSICEWRDATRCLTTIRYGNLPSDPVSPEAAQVLGDVENAGDIAARFIAISDLRKTLAEPLPGFSAAEWRAFVIGNLPADPAA